MSTGRTVSLVARRELAARLRTRSFVLGTVLSALVLAGFVLTQSTLFDDRHRDTIGLNGQAIAVTEQLAEEARQVGRDVATVEVTDLADGRAQVADGRLDALVSGAPAALTVLVDSGLDDELRGVLNGLVRQQVLRGQLAALADPTNLDADAVLRTVAEAHVTVRTLSSPDPAHGERLAVALVVVALLYLALLLYGSLVAQGVVAEKSSGVAEFLLPVVRPGQLLGGKVVGLGLVGLLQLVAVGLVGLVVALATKVLTSAGSAVTALSWGLVWYVLGFLLYATVFAAVGTLVSRQEDVQSVLMPVTVVLLVAFVLGFAVLSRDSSGTLITVLSLVPPLSPLLMPGRLALAAVPVWQTLLALGLTVAAIAVLARVCGRMYRNSLLRPGSRVTLRTALRRVP
ncbi:ABC transporter permease [Actinophytocola glycyrrhizae]|uniref:ABC transporter permease n=1 Tax=Actinophytocola glycyrrhizae TaxID=2044873 RepID=A0ABV9S0S8_9PSEU